MGYSYKGPPTKKPPVNAGISRPGSRNCWWMGVCKVHGETPHQTPFGCEKCQTASLREKGLIES